MATHSLENPYAPPVDTNHLPGADSSVPMDLDSQLAATQRTMMVKAAVGLVATTGSLLVICALQLWAVGIRGSFAVVPFIMVAAGVGAVYSALKIYRQRVSAVIAGIALSAAITIGMATWFVISLLSGFISLLPLLVPAAGTLATIFAALALGPCRRTAQARARLAANGLDVDF